MDFDPRAWAKAARRAGMKYAVMTAKHHDGFCLVRFGADRLQGDEYEGGKGSWCGSIWTRSGAEGLKVGLNYSLLDWHHPDYPKYGDWHHPMRGNEAFKDDVYDFENYPKYMHGQVKELVTNYGKLDLLWFDFSYGDMCAEKWKAAELIEMVRTYQPDVLIDNRLEGSGEKRKHRNR